MHKTQPYYARLDLLSLVKYLTTRVLTIYHAKRTQNKPQCWSNTAFDLRSFRPHSLTFGYF